MSSYMDIEKLIENDYFIDVTNKKVYKTYDEDVIKLSYSSRKIPKYYNMNSVEKYENNKKDLVAYFEGRKTRFLVENSKVKMIYNNMTKEYSLNISKWDSNYIYFSSLQEYKLRYNVLKNKYEITGYSEVSKEEFEQ